MPNGGFFGPNVRVVGVGVDVSYDRSCGTGIGGWAVAFRRAIYKRHGGGGLSFGGGGWRYI